MIYPPIKTDLFKPIDKKEDFYLTASRMVPYKKVDLIVESFAKMPDKTLIVIGDGPEMAKVKSKAAANIHILGYQPNNVLIDYMQRAKAFIFAAEEESAGIISPMKSTSLWNARHCCRKRWCFGNGERPKPV